MSFRAGWKRPVTKSMRYEQCDMISKPKKPLCWGNCDPEGKSRLESMPVSKKEIEVFEDEKETFEALSKWTSCQLVDFLFKLNFRLFFPKTGI